MSSSGGFGLQVTVNSEHKLHTSLVIIIKTLLYMMNNFETFRRPGLLLCVLFQARKTSAYTSQNK
jgi:hypothetical protein